MEPSCHFLKQRPKFWLSLLTFNVIIFCNDFHSHRFQGCIGHVTQTAPSESPRSLALRSSAWTGSDCGSFCAPGWKCNRIDDVTRKECECPGYGNDETICKLHFSRSNNELATIITASSSILSQSVQITANTTTPVLSSTSYTNVKVTSSSKITDSSTPTIAHSVPKHVQDSSGVKAQYYADVEYLDQRSSVPGNLTHPRSLGFVSASTSSFPLNGLSSNSIEVRLDSSVDNNGSAMAKKGSTLRILSSLVLVCLALTVSLFSGLMTR